MSITDRDNPTSRSTSRTLIGSMGRGLEKILSSPTPRVRTLRREMESQQIARQQRSAATSVDIRETLELATRYLRSLPNS
ncbi:hypothetical protein MMAD_13330 [Mycolicibacterium madagascariense]|uniref:Uncharacterized protein n=1 Tax=Mycolicibacterium madagascariense TaxID=212765 RepID=A0A7I7XE98_9MYCO|nr:hypothetical protein [Mycolicibacterium madagascariense]MCV7013589.1 hypothetical protein [Mycolicibacterium madagascariense]BBZ27038.1 hypothetical protein MMAD_13330 [Mycolicibacterium madagascariense]